MLGYLANPRVGALAYSVFHTSLLPSVVVVVGVVTGREATSAVGIVWCAPIGMERALGDGLKYAENFRQTHLGFSNGPVGTEATRSLRCRTSRGPGRREPPGEGGGLPRNASLRGDP